MIIRIKCIDYYRSLLIDSFGSLVLKSNNDKRWIKTIITSVKILIKNNSTRAINEWLKLSIKIKPRVAEINMKPRRIMLLFMP